MPSGRPDLERLKRRIAAIEGRGARFAEPGAGAAAPWSLGAAEVDRALPGGGLGRRDLHDIVPAAYLDAPAAAGLCLGLIARLTAPGDILWCQTAESAREFGRLYGRGLRRFGVSPGRLNLVRVQRADDLLWAMEEGLHATGLAAVIGEGAQANLTASRRLALAARDGATPALLLRAPRGPAPSAARTRWRVAAGPSAGLAFDRRAPGCPRWALALERCPGGRPGAWEVEWDDETGAFRLAAPLADRPAAPRRSAPAAGGTGDLRRTG